MIRSFLRLLWPTIDPMPTPRQRAAELSAGYAVASFVSAGRAPPLTPDRDHRLDGLSGTRALQMLDVQRAGFDRDPATAAAGLALVRQSLTLELGSADRREAAHLRMLEAFASSLEALRASQRQDSHLDDDGRERIALQAAEAASRLPDEPYLRFLQARTLESLGRTEEAAALLDAFGAGAWLGGWQGDFAARSGQLRSAAGRLPQGTAVERLRAMSRQPGWLGLAGADLPGLLGDEAGAVPWPTVDDARLVLQVSDRDFDDPSANALLGSAQDEPPQSTIGALRVALRRRFGVVLPGARLRAVGLPAGQATAFLDGSVVAATTELATAAPNDLLVEDVVAWWPGVTDAAPALRVLLLAALRSLTRFPAEVEPTSREAAESRETMLADRMATTPITPDGSASLQVAALRLQQPDGEPLWGNDATYAPVLLDADVEDVVQASLVPALGLALAADHYVRLATALRAHAAADPRPVALVVRDPLLRPLLRLLLLDDFPDLPVLALAEVVFGGGRVLVTLGISPPTL